MTERKSKKSRKIRLREFYKRNAPLIWSLTIGFMAVTVIAIERR